MGMHDRHRCELGGCCCASAGLQTVERSNVLDPARKPGSRASTRGKSLDHFRILRFSHCAKRQRQRPAPPAKISPNSSNPSSLIHQHNDLAALNFEHQITHLDILIDAAASLVSCQRPFEPCHHNRSSSRCLRKSSRVRPRRICSSPPAVRRTKLKISIRSSVDLLNLQEHAAADSPENR